MKPWTKQLRQGIQTEDEKTSRFSIYTSKNNQIHFNNFNDSKQNLWKNKTISFNKNI